MSEISILGVSIPQAMSFARRTVQAWTSGSAMVRAVIVVGWILSTTSLGLFIYTVNSGDKLWPAIAVAFAVFGVGMMAAPALARDARDQSARDAKIYDLETAASQDQAPPRLAWDLARIKLESYLDRNLSQVSVIFTLVSFVMMCGMALIGIGVWRAIVMPNTLAPAALSALAGIIVQVIARTFLVVYRSTMEQAKGYVVVLERINAVGMSLNILEGIETTDLSQKDAARISLAGDLLGMYRATPSKRRASTTKKAAR